MTQETLEEAAEKLYPNDGFFDEIYCDINEYNREKWIEGVKQQQERSYSEAIDLFITEIKSEFKDYNWDYLEFIKERVLEQFKKK